MKKYSLWSALVLVSTLLVAPAANAALFRRAPAQILPPPEAVRADAQLHPALAPAQSNVLVLSPAAMPPAMPVSYSKVAISYRHVGRPIASSCDPVATRVLCVTNPRTCCQVQVPVCLPCCCDDSPKVHGRRTLIGDGVVHFDYCCGVTVSVRFDRCGDVLVTYRRA